ncbi:type II toxin-antitoxin system VapC family toxin [Candidatus Bathyarchaeota archaeon]|nr:type II toxin-antitoxin system VapC family toxin [Candidatus Bathyarchaeota archaeon]
MKRLRSLTLDSNIFISEVKGDETYSDECGALISRIGVNFFLVEPALVLTEVGNAVGRNINLKAAEEEVDALLRMISVLIPCDKGFCVKAGLTGVEYDVYSADSLYLQAAISFKSVLVSLDEEFINKIKAKEPPIEVYHVKDFPYQQS